MLLLRRLFVPVLVLALVAAETCEYRKYCTRHREIMLESIGDPSSHMNLFDLNLGSLIIQMNSHYYIPVSQSLNNLSSKESPDPSPRCPEMIGLHVGQSQGAQNGHKKKKLSANAVKKQSYSKSQFGKSNPGEHILNEGPNLQQQNVGQLQSSQSHYSIPSSSNFGLGKINPQSHQSNLQKRQQQQHKAGRVMSQVLKGANNPNSITRQSVPSQLMPTNKLRGMKSANTHKTLPSQSVSPSKAPIESVSQQTPLLQHAKQRSPKFSMSNNVNRQLIEQISKPSGQKPAFNQIQEPQKRQQLSPPTNQLQLKEKSYSKPRMPKAGTENSGKNPIQKRSSIKRQSQQLIRGSSSLENKKKSNVTFACNSRAQQEGSPEKTDNANKNFDKQEQRGESIQHSSSSHSDNYATNKAEASLQKRKISGTNQQNRASQLSRNFEHEEEKEVPNEHPSGGKYTPMREGQNIDSQKCFTLQNMASGLYNSASHQRYQKMTSGRKTLKQKSSDEKSSGLVDRSQELSNKKDDIFMNAQRKLLTDISDYEAQANQVNPGFQAKQLNYRMQNLRPNNPHQVRIQREHGQMGLHERKGDSHSFISPENSFVQSRPHEEEKQIRVSPKISDRGHHQLWCQTPQQPQIVMDDHQLRLDNVMAIDQQFLYEQQLIQEQVQESKRKYPQTKNLSSFADQRLLNDNMQSNISIISTTSYFMKSSMASCDLQASFSNNIGHVTDNHMFQPQVMMQSNQQRRRLDQLRCQQQVMDDMRSFDDMQGNIPYDPAPSRAEDDMLSSSDFMGVSQTRLWKEIFYLRRQLAQRDETIQQMNGTIQSLQGKLKIQARNNSAQQNQLSHLQDNYLHGKTPEMLGSQESQELQRQSQPRDLIKAEDQLRNRNSVFDNQPRQPVHQRLDPRDYEEEKNEVVGQELGQIQQVQIQRRTDNAGVLQGLRDRGALVTEAQQDDLPQTSQINASQFEGLEHFSRINYSSQIKDREQLRNIIVSEEQSLQKQAEPEISNASSSKLNQMSPVKLQQSRPGSQAIANQGNSGDAQDPRNSLEPVDENSSNGAQDNQEQDQPSIGQQSYAIDSSLSGDPQAQPIPQQVNSFSPPTQASNVHMVRQYSSNEQERHNNDIEEYSRNDGRLENINEVYVPPNSTRVARAGNFLYTPSQEPPQSQRNHLRQYELELHDSIHSLPNQGMSVHRISRMQPHRLNYLENRHYPMMVHSSMPLEESKQPSSNIHASSNNVARSSNLLEHEQEDNNHFTTNESILINKVNEMQIKTSRFGSQRNGRRWGFREAFNSELNAHRQNLYMSLVMQQQGNRIPQSLHHSYAGSGLEERVFIQQRPRSHQLLHLRPRQSYIYNGDIGLEFQEQELDEQVESGIRLIAGPREGIARGINNQSSAIIYSRQPLISQVPAESHSMMNRRRSSANNMSQLQQQRPCEQPPPRNIQGDVQSHVDGEDLGALEGVGSGLVPQQRIPLPNQQQQPIPRHPSHESLVDPEPSVQQNHSTNRSQEGQQEALRHQFVNSVDDAGMDEFDVAEERAHLFGESVNPDIMTYEQLLALQDRIGFVCRGMTVQEMDKFPMMKRSEYRQFIRSIAQPSHRSRQNLGRNSSPISHRSMRAFQSQRNHPTNNDHQRVEIQEEQKSQPQRGHTVQDQNEIEEESKSLLDQESLREKSMESNSSRPSSVLENVKSNSLNGTNKLNGLNIGLNRNFESQHRPRDIMVNQQDREALLPQEQVSLSQSQSQQVRQQNFKLPKVELREGEEEGRPVNSNIQLEEGKEDLEDAAPEEHHPKEEHLQQIGVSVPMPGHHVAQHSHAQSQPQQSLFIMSHRELHSDRNMIAQNSQSFPHLSPQQRRSQVILPSGHYEMAQDELLPGEERKQPVRGSSRLQNRGVRQMRQDSQEPDIEESKAGIVEALNDVDEVQGSNRNAERQRNNRESGSQEGSQEDVYDEGEDLLNSRLPIVMNINGSIPNQQPAKIRGFQSEEQSVDPNRDHPVYASALQIQSNLAPRQNQRNQPRAVNEEQKESFGGEDDFGMSSNVYEEHKEHEYGVQTPKYAQTKRNRTQQDGQPRKQFLFNDAMKAQRLQGAHGEGQIGLMQPQVDLVNQPQLSQSSSRSKAVSRLSQSQVSTLGQDLCIICQEVYTADDMIKVITPCNHYFHINCVNQWLLVEKKCPMCMNPLP